MLSRALFPVLAFAAVLALGGPGAAAQESSQVQFQAGKDGAILSGSITGHQYRDYLLRAGKGQTMTTVLTVESTNGHGIAYFNVLPPGSQDLAIYVGSRAIDHASGSLRCTMANAQQGGVCPFEVTREGDGTAKVTVDKPDGQSRVIFFKGGKATGYRQTQQANPERFSASKQGDTSIVTIGGERYEIPDAVVFGG